MATDIRAELEKLMAATIADHANWTYRAIRPLAVPASWAKGQRVVGDCSKGCQYLVRWSGAGAWQDPLGQSFGQFGNSASACMHLAHLSSPSQLLVGDLVSFGPGGSDHLAMVKETGVDPLVWSFGHQGAPNTYRLSWDRRPKQYLRLAVAVYVPTADDKLRAMTGYFAWMKWLLGEGEWRNKKPKDRRVRPDVPRRIPASWWVNRAKFLLRRDRADRVPA